MDEALKRRPEVLREYALLADGERGALIGPRGEIVWLCAPRWDSDAVFAMLLGGAGEYTVCPVDEWFVPGGFYEEGSLIFRSRWRLAGGTVECREALAFPGDPHRLVLLRRVNAVEGDIRVRVALDPRADFGRARMREVRFEAGCWHARVGSLYLRWSGCEHAGERDGALMATLTLDRGRTHDLVLEVSDRPLPDSPPGAAGEWERTERAWRDSVPALDTRLATRDAKQAYAVQRGMTTAYGGMASACTASLPERARAGRNYDYRYTWIRDQCFAGQALSLAGDGALPDDLATFVAERVLADGADLRPVYTTSGGPVPGEHVLEGLRGYPGGVPKVGNQASEQFQLDALGEALLLFASVARRHELDDVHRRAVEKTVAAIERRWTEPDAGVWELHEAKWAHSRLTCAAGLRAVARTSPVPAQAARWTSLAGTIVDDVTNDCLHPNGRWQRAPGDPRVDSALLLPAIRGAIPAHDPRSVATLDTVRAELTEDGYVYRFRHDERPLHSAEGAFLLCGFIMALACRQQGKPVEARGWFERSRAACGPPGLYAEEYDVVQRQLRGNLPQTFVHSMLLEAACRLD